MVAFRLSAISVSASALDCACAGDARKPKASPAAINSATAAGTGDAPSGARAGSPSLGKITLGRTVSNSAANSVSVLSAATIIEATVRSPSQR